jgi:hypothetical protein
MSQRQEAEPAAGARRIAELEAELGRATRRIESLEASTSLRVGRLIVDAARSPGAAVRLPLDLLRLARRRGRAGRAERDGRHPVRAGRGVAVTPVGADEQRRFLAYSAVTVGPRERLSVAAIVHPSTVAALEPDAIVNPLLPHDATLVLERAEPDLLLVETASFRPGLPWAYTGDPAASDRGRALLEALELARAMGHPSVLWRNTADHEAVGIANLESRFDLVVPALEGPFANWSVGVQLALANPIGAPGSRSPNPVLLAAADDRLPGVRRRELDQALAAIPGLITLPGDPASPPELRREACRQHEVAIIAGPDRALVLEALACGCRVVVVGDADLGELGKLVTVCPTPRDLQTIVATAVAEGAPANPELRTVLRTLWRRYATPLMLDRLSRELLLEPSHGSGRSVAVVAGPLASEEASTLVDDLARQEVPPLELLLIGPLAVEEPGRLAEAFGAAGASSIAVRRLTDPATAAAAADATWLWPWVAESRPTSTTLVDLLLAAEMSRADVAGLVDGPGGFGVRPEPGRSLVRRSALQRTPGIDPFHLDEVIDRGWRTFGLEAIGERPG